MISIAKIRTHLLYLFVFLLPWQTRLILRTGELNREYWEYGTVSLYAVEMLLWAIIALTVIEVLIRKRKTQNAKRIISINNLKLFYFVGALILIGLISIFQASSISLAFYWWLKIVAGAALFFIIIKSEVNFKKLIGAFVAGAVIQAGLGIWQFATQSVFASKWLGMAAQTPLVLGTSVVETDGLRFLRAYGGFSHPNILGAYLVIAIFLTMWIFSKQNISKNFQFLGIISGLIIIAGLFLSFSRAAWLAFLIIILMYGYDKIHAFFHDREKMRGFYFPLLSGIFFFLILSLLFWPIAQSRVLSSERLEIKSMAERVVGYSEAWQLIKKHSLFGVGPGNYTLAVYNEIDATWPPWNYQPVHNVYMLVLAELGIFGLLAFLGFLFFLAGGFRRPATGTIGVGSAMTVLLFLLFFDHFFWSMTFGVLFFWFIIGVDYRFLKSSDI